MIQHCITALLLMPFISSDTLAAQSQENEPASLSKLLLREDGPAIGGWFEASYSDFAGNFAVARNRIHVGGDFNDVSYMISVGYDDEGSSFGLRDAYATAPWGSTNWTFGQFRAPTTSSHLVDESKQFFLDRTGFGGDGLRQTGLMGNGSFDNFGWAIALMDDDAPELAGDEDEDLHARVSFDILGAASSSSQGSYDTLGSTNLSIAAAIDNGKSGDSTYIEATMSNGPFWAHVELVDRDAASPLTFAATYTITTQYEIGFRSEDDDDDDDDPTISVAINRYISGHDCKCTVQFDDGVDYDEDGSIDQRLSAGFLVSF
jgi:hypothetical protein